MPKMLPMIPLRGMMIFPHMVLCFDVGRDFSVNAVETAVMQDQPLFLVSQRDPRVEDPQQEDLQPVGTVCTIKQIMREPNENLRLLVEGLYRGELLNITEADGCRKAQIRLHKDRDGEPTVEQEAYMRLVVETAERFAGVGDTLPAETVATLKGIRSAGELADVLAAHVVTDERDKQRILELYDVDDRLEHVLTVLRRELEISTKRNTSCMSRCAPFKRNWAKRTKRSSVSCAS